MNKFKIFKELIKRKKYKLYELIFKIAKSIFFDLRFFYGVRFYFFKFFISNFKYSLMNLINFCFISYKILSFFKFIRLNRLIFKEFLKFGFLSGMRKASW